MPRTDAEHDVVANIMVLTASMSSLKSLRLSHTDSYRNPYYLGTRILGERSACNEDKYRSAFIRQISLKNI